MYECGRCSRGPEGLEGHYELALCIDDQPHYGAAKGNHLFRCLGCSQVWTRYYEGEGGFRWTRRE